MESTHFKIGTKELILKHGKEGGGTETFVYEPANIEEERFGNLYIIGRLENRKSEFEFLPNLVASVMKREFYKLDDADGELHFENALKKANATLHDIGKANEGVLEDAHFCVVNIAGETIRLSKFGNIITFLYRENEVVDMAKKHKRGSAHELFSAVITGNVALDDKFILSTGKTIDLFSEKGIEKLFALSLDEQADIIGKMYQKNAREIPFPTQALILLTIASAKTTWLPFGKKAETKVSIAVSTHRYFAGMSALMRRITRGFAMVRTLSPRDLRKKIATYSKASLHKRNSLIFLAVTLVFIIGGSGYAFLRTQVAFLDDIQRRIITADKGDDTSASFTLLNEARDDTLRMTSSLLFGSLAQKIAYEIEVKINLLAGIHIAQPFWRGNIPTSALRFQPHFIFDDNDFIYIFGNEPSVFYTIAKQTNEGSYTFLVQAPADFEIEKMFMRDGDLYMIDDTKQSALLFSFTEKSLTRVVKTLKSTLATKAPQNTRTHNDADYILEGGNKIIRTPKQKDGLAEKYLVGELRDITDFTISSDQEEIYILTPHAVFSVAH